MAARLDLTQHRRIQTVLRSRWLPFALQAVTLAGFVLTILAGLIGSPVGSHNFAIVFVWIAWWSALKMFFIPFGGRSWCSICPIPMPGEWLLRGGILSTPTRPPLARLRWPRRLSGTWLQAAGFLLVGLFGALTLTTPRVTSVILLGIIILALSMSFIFGRRAYCRRLCPIGGFTGLYAQAAPVEVRVKDPALCAAHSEKTCYTACPWGQYPLALKSSANCGLCMECLRACPVDNIAVNMRPWGSELGTLTRRPLDEPFLALVMLASALVDAAVFLGPWGDLKSAAYAVGSTGWLIFAGSFLLIGLGLLPGLYVLAVWIGARLDRSPSSLRTALAHASPALVPLGLMAWIAFTISFALSKAGYVLPVLSDPLGWGWNLLGVSSQALVGQTTSFSLMLQVSVLTLGLFWSVRVARRISASVRQALPIAGFAFAFTLAMSWLLVG
jgi:polyferredoxin